MSRGASAAIGPLTKPGWCVAVEATLPAPSSRVPRWLEVGVRGPRRDWFCSVPLGRLPQLQIGLVPYGHHLTYITRVQVADDDR
jgi:hypothetical protein